MPSFKNPLYDRGQSGQDYRMALGAYVRDCRTARGMTQTEMALAVGMTHKSGISSIEVGRNSVPSERYLAFAEALGIKPETFGREVLRLTDPWMYAMLFSKNPKAEIDQLNRSFNNG